MPIADACNKIANIIEDYRDGEFGVYDASHVKRWLDQFDENEQEIVILETLKILKRNYITQKAFYKFIETLIDSDAVYKQNKDNYWNTVSVLDIQHNGHSQDELNNILKESILERYQVDNLIDKDSDEFIYLDDFIFSGNRLYSDMRDWITSHAPNKCRVCVITIGWFTFGQWNAKNKLTKLAEENKKQIEFQFISFTQFRLENRLSSRSYSDVFWPTDSITNLMDYDNWFASENFDPKFRVPNGVQNKIFSTSRREEYERIIFKYGLKIMSFSAHNSSVVKPLGYSTFRGFGFGSTVFSFRNCPNNNPLAFWWGDPSASSSHPFSKWYPLLQRKTYGI